MPANMTFIDNVTVIPADWLNNVNAFVNSGAGAGTVTNVLFSASNGFSASISNSHITPNITLSVTVTGILVGTGGGGLTTAVAGTDYLAPPSGTALLRANNGGALAAAVAGSDYLPGTSGLVSGLLKSQTGTGALSIAQNIDLPAMSATQGGAVPTPPNSTSYFLRGDGAWGIPAGGGGGGGGVSSVTGNNSGGFTVTVANPTTTPAITVGCSVTGLLKASGGSVSSAVAGSDFTAGTAGLSTGILKSTNGSGTITIAVAGDFPTLNQNTTGTAAGLSATLAVGSGGTGVTTSTGSGANVLATSPALVTPTADGFAVGYKIMPPNSQSVAYTLVAGDSGGFVLHPSADVTPRTFTIPSNASVAYPIGTVLTFVNQHSAGALTIAINSDTMRLAGAGTTGSRTLAADGIAEALKVTSTEWIINGTGLS